MIVALRRASTRRAVASPRFPIGVAASTSMDPVSQSSDRPRAREAPQGAPYHEPLPGGPPLPRRGVRALPPRGAAAPATLVRVAASPVWRWAGPLAVTLLAALLRFWNLGHPPTLMFDET